jgi:hypothetical protein
MIREVDDEVFVPGDVWSYDTRPTETDSRIIILRVDKDANTVIVHIRLEGLKLKNPQGPGGISHTVAHVPYDKAALQSIVREKTGTSDVSDLGGYIHWREAYGAGKAGINTLPLVEILDAIEDKLKAGAK